MFRLTISRPESIWIAIANSVLQLPTSPLVADEMEALVPNHGWASASASASPSAVAVAVVEPLVVVLEALVRVGLVNSSLQPLTLKMTSNH